MQVPEDARTSLDDEDLLLQRLLLSGVSFQSIVDTEALSGLLQLLRSAEIESVSRGLDESEDVNEDDMPEDELTRYIRTDAEVRASCLSCTWLQGIEYIVVSG